MLYETEVEPGGTCPQVPRPAEGTSIELQVVASAAQSSAEDHQVLRVFDAEGNGDTLRLLEWVVQRHLTDFRVHRLFPPCR